MTPAANCLERGTLFDCLMALIARSGHFPTEYLTIAFNDVSHYYVLADAEHDCHSLVRSHSRNWRIVAEISDLELQTIARVFDTLQGDLFDQPQQGEIPLCTKEDSTATATAGSQPSPPNSSDTSAQPSTAESDSPPPPAGVSS